MAAKRVPAGRDQLAPVIRAALGGGHHLRSLTRLPGGSKKGVYRALLDDESTAIVYVWAEEENYWPAPAAALLEHPAAGTAGHS